MHFCIDNFHFGSKGWRGSANSTFTVRDLYSSPDPQTRKYPRKYRLPHKIFLYVPEVYKMGKKITFPLRFLYVNFKIFSQISNLNWFFAQKRKILPLAFLIYFRIIKDFQNSIKFALIFIKISFVKSKFAKISWKVSKFCRFPLIFRLIF